MPVSRQPLCPKIDADLLAEYILAGPERRRDILLNECAQSDEPRHFRAADETVCAYLLSIPKQESAVTRKIEVLQTLQAFAPEKQARIADNIAALEAFLSHPKREFLDNLETFPGPRQGMLRLAGVNVAVWVCDGMLLIRMLAFSVPENSPITRVVRPAPVPWLMAMRPCMFGN